jgi:protein-glutamine gamma-glutamyltransferase
MAENGDIFGGLRRLLKKVRPKGVLSSAVSVSGEGSRSLKIFFAGAITLSLAAACIENGLPRLFLAFLPIAGVALYRSEYKRPFFGTERLLTILLVPYVAILTLMAYVMPGYVLNLPVFLCFFTSGIMLVRVFAPLTDRNMSQLVFLSVGLILVNCILTNHMAFALILPFYLFTLMVTLLLFNLAKHRRISSPSTQYVGRDGSLRGRPGNLSKHALFILAVTVALFVFLPRPFAVFPGIRAAISGGRALADLEKQITYRDMVRMQDRKRIAFVVRLEEGTLPRDCYWRGRVLEKTDGEGWYALKKQRSRARTMSLDHGRRVVYRIAPLRLQSKQLYVAGVPVWVTGRGRKPLFITSANEVVVDSVFLYDDSYKVRAVKKPIPLERGGPDALTLNTKGITPRIRQLAEDWTKGLSSSREKAEALAKNLKSRCRYQLQTPPPPDKIHPMEYFLFTSRTGNCEYFAGALGLMLRAVGVPSRVVEGFLGYEETDNPREFIVRFARAHAWVEALVDETHWTTLDATPPAPGEALASPLWNFVNDLYDKADYQWIKLVVNFDRHDQIVMLDSVARAFQRLRSINLMPRMTVASSTITAVVFVGLSVALLLLFRSIRARRIGPSGIYLKTMRDLVKRGVLRKIHPWHEKNVNEILEQAPYVRDKLTAFIALYLRGRFGMKHYVPEEEMERARQELISSLGHG